MVWIAVNILLDKSFEVGKFKITSNVKNYPMHDI